MKVYILMRLVDSGDYSEHWVTENVYSSREKAEVSAKVQFPMHKLEGIDYSLDIEEWDVDDME